MKILVTGTTGFIGSHVAVHLAKSGHEVVATSRHPESFPALTAFPGIETRRLDLQDREDWPSLLAGCQALVHVALGWGDEGPTMIRQDTEASIDLFEAARVAGVQKVVYTSSTAANGEMDPLNTPDRAPRPIDFYGATKAATEMFARAYSAHGMEVQVIRPGYIFGEPVLPGGRSQPDRRFRELCQAVLTGSPFHVVRHDGTQFLGVEDIARVYAKLVEHSSRFSIHYALSQAWRSWEWVAREAMDLAGRTTEIVVEDRGYGETPFLFDVSGIREDFGLSFDNAQSLRAHLEWELERTAAEI
ncbi:MAG: NAD(P)-dependent oxidoreductase [Fibrobacteria bacterium]|nr:NAD(P)-dependent oxidoreductase [Fibrobacteria bacterium]